MKNTIKYLVVILLLTISTNALYGQVSRWEETKSITDSSQRNWMRRVLELDDSLITKLFLARNKMYLEVGEIRKNKSIAEPVQETRVLAIRKATESEIYQILGEGKYKIYTDKIRQRLERNGKQNYLPLTGSIY